MALLGRGNPGWASRPREFLNTSLWGLVDQALISASNFAVMVLLARQLGPGAFGMFVIAYTVLLFANSIQGSLITLPHNVLGATRSDREYARFTTATAVAQFLFSTGVGLIIGCVAFIIVALDYDIGSQLLVLAPVSIAWQLQEFVRRVLYTQLDYRGAFLNDVIAYGGQMAGVVVLWELDRLSAVNAWMVLGVTSGIGLTFGLWQLRAVITTSITRKELRADLSETWVFGRWLLASSLTYWVTSQLYPLLTAGFVGLAATGGLRAAQNLVAPTHIVLKSVESIVPSRAARAHSTSGQVGLRDFIWWASLPGGLAIAAYCLVSSIFAEPVVALLFGSGFTQYAWVVPFVAVAYVLTYLSTIATILLQTLARTSPIFHANLITALLVLTIGVWSVSEFGLAAAAAGMVLNGCVLNIVLWREVRITLRPDEPLPATSNSTALPNE